jgi:hypothetical protein
MEIGIQNTKCLILQALPILLFYKANVYYIALILYLMILIKEMSSLNHGK